MDGAIITKIGPWVVPSGTPFLIGALMVIIALVLIVISIRKIYND